MSEEIQLSRQQDMAVTLKAGNVPALLFNPAAFAQVERVATLMADGTATVPAHLRGNVGDCMAITIQALTWGMSPWPVAQKTHMVNGTLGYEAQLVSAVITAMAPTKDRLHYEWFGPWEKIVGKFEWKTGNSGKRYQAPAWRSEDEEGLGVKVWATIKGEDEPRVLELLLSQAQVRNSTLWASDPKQQLAYLGTKRWSRLYTPDVIMGVYTPDELAEPTLINVTAEGTDKTLNEQATSDRTKSVMDRVGPIPEAKPQPAPKKPEKPKAAKPAKSAKPEPKAQAKPGLELVPEPSTDPETKIITGDDVSKALAAPSDIVLEFFKLGVASVRGLENLALPKSAKGLFQLTPEQRAWIVHPDNIPALRSALSKWVDSRDNAQ